MKAIVITMRIFKSWKCSPSDQQRSAFRILKFHQAPISTFYLIFFPNLILINFPKRPPFFYSKYLVMEKCPINMAKTVLLKIRGKWNMVSMV